MTVWSKNNTHARASNERATVRNRAGGAEAEAEAEACEECMQGAL